MVMMRVNRCILYVTLSIMACLYLVPVYLVLVTSFKPTSEIDISTMWHFPHALDLYGMSQAWASLSANFLNSVYMVVPAVIISSLIGALNGYALSKWRFRGSNVVFFFLLFGMFIPYQSVLIPLLEVLQSIGLYNTIAGLAFVHIVYGIPITTLIFRNFYSAIPDDLIEAGKIDGSGYFGIFRHIILPLSISGFVVVGIWQFTNIWNEFLFGVTLTIPPHQPITAALQNLSGSQVIQWNVQMSGALLTSLPTLLVYLILGKYFVRGLLAGSVKG